MDKALIDTFESGGSRVKAAIAGLSSEQLRWRPPGDANIGRWSIQQVVLHLMDSDLIWTSRMKLIIAEDNPQIIAYDETKFANSLMYDQQDAARAVEILDLNRRQFAMALRRLDAPAFARTGRHSEIGPITLAFSIQAMIGHIDHHLRFIEQKKAAPGWKKQPQSPT